MTLSILVGAVMGTPHSAVSGCLFIEGRCAGEGHLFDRAWFSVLHPAAHEGSLRAVTFPARMTRCRQLAL